MPEMNETPTTWDLGPERGLILLTLLQLSSSADRQPATCIGYTFMVAVLVYFVGPTSAQQLQQLAQLAKIKKHKNEHEQNF